MLRTAAQRCSSMAMGAAGTAPCPSKLCSDRASAPVVMPVGADWAGSLAGGAICCSWLAARCALDNWAEVRESSNARTISDCAAGEDGAREAKEILPGSAVRPCPWAAKAALVLAARTASAMVLVGGETGALAGDSAMRYLRQWLNTGDELADGLPAQR